MYRRIVVSNATWSPNSASILYHVRGAKLLSQYRASSKGFDKDFANITDTCAVVFADSIRLYLGNGVGADRTYEFVLDVVENQPTEESVKELTTTGVTITVFNENGVVVCRNTPKTPANSDPAQTGVSGEMTSVPGEEPGEMASETTPAPGEMTSVPIEAPGEMI